MVASHTSHLACGRRHRRALRLLPQCACGVLFFLTVSLSGGKDSHSQEQVGSRPTKSISEAATIEENARAPAAESADDQKERVAAERFLELLKKRPRLGTALDKVYGYHVQRGSLDQFSQSLRDQASASNSGEAWLLLGLVSMQRGQDADARVALEKAEQLLTKDPLASFYLGRTLIMLGEVDQAALALERAIERNPAKADMLRIFQELGRLYQRMRRVDDAVAVWNRMEKLFPGDTQVQEQIAVVLAEEGANQEALARYESLVKSTKDRYRQIEMAVRAAQLKGVVGRREEALADFEKILGQVNPDSWIYQDVRNRVDALFLNRNDYDGLAAYYTAWMERHPDDIDAMLRIGRLLSVQRRSPEAKIWFGKAISKAPTEAAPRLALVEALERDNDVTAAVAAMKEIVELQQDNPDTIVRLGELIFSNRSVPEAERAAEAAKVWKKLLDKRADDPVTVARVADLLRGAQQTEEALAGYRKAVELASDEPQYREYLGEFLFRLERKDEALAVWRELATGSRETRDNLVRLSEVYSTFKLEDEALATMAKACEHQPTFGHRVRYAEMLRDDKEFDSALEQLVQATKLAESPEEHALVLDEQIKNYQSSGQLEKQIIELEQAVQGADKKNARAWEKLALLQEADRKYQQAAESIARASEVEPQSISVHSIAVRVQERAGSFGDAIASLRKLAALDRRFLSSYLTQIATLQMRLGQMDDALATGGELISASGANSEQFRFFADLCFQAGKSDQGLDALRRNVRSNPTDRDAVRLLARSLSGQFKTEEAIELHWRSYALSPDMDEKRADVEALTELYLRTNRFDQLVARLETSGREDNRQREATVLIAAAHQAAGDLGAARLLLEPLLRAESRDAALLGTVIKLAQAEFDWDAAVQYQKRLNEVAPSPEGEYQLAKLLLEQGETEQAESVWLKLSSKFATPENLGQTIDRLLTKGDVERALSLANQAVEREPENWEILPVAIAAYWRAERRDRAVELAEQLLKLSVAGDTRSASAKQLVSKQAAQSGSAPATSRSPLTSPVNLNSRNAWLIRLSQNTSRLRLSASRSPFGSSYSYSGTYPPLIIYSFADARVFAAAIKASAQPIESSDKMEAWLQEQLASDDTEQIWSALALAQFVYRQTTTTVPMAIAGGGVAMRAGTANPASVGKKSPRVRLTERLVELGDLDASAQLLSTLYSERQNQNRSGAAMKRAPLNESELKLLVELYSKSGNVGLGTAGRSPTYTIWLADEFKLAERREESQKYFEEAKSIIEANPQNASASSLLSWDRPLAILAFLDWLARNAKAQRGAASMNSYFQTGSFVAALLNDAPDGTDVEYLIAQLKLQQAAYAKQLRPSQLAEYDPAKNVVNTNFGISTPSGVQTISIQIDFPTQSALQSVDLLVSLRLVHTCKSETIKQAVAKRLEVDANTADEDVMLSAIDQLCYASWLWWSDSKTAALEQMDKLKALGVAPELTKILQSRMLYEVGRIDESLATLESLKPLNQQLLQDKELAVLQLVLQKGDTLRARQSAERLFALRLPTPTQLQIAELMNQLGMREMADSVMQRVRQRGGSDLSTQLQVMQRLTALKNIEGACEVARQILRRTQPSVGRNMRTMDDTYRQQAVRTLVNAGEAKTMITSLEGRLEKSPNSQPVILALAELYEATGKAAESQKVLSRLSKGNAQDPRAMLASARALAQARKYAEAVDQYLSAFEKQPDLMNNEYYNFRTAVQQAKNWKHVVDRLEKIGISRFGRSYRFGELLTELLRSGEEATGKKLLKSLIKENGLMALVDISGSIVSAGSGNLRRVIVDDDELKQLAFDQFTSAISPQTNPVQFFQRRSQGSDGRVMSFLALLNLLFEKDSARVGLLLEKIEPLREQDAHWLVMQAALVTMSKDYERAGDIAKELSRLPDSLKVALANPAWELASLLAHEHSQYQVAVDILEPWNVLARPRSSEEVSFTAQGLLLYCYVKLKRVEDAKSLLDKEVVSFVGDPSMSASNPGYAEYQVFRFRLSAAQKYLSIQAPLDALQLTRSLKSDQKMLEAASRWGYSIEMIDQQIAQVDSTAIKSIDAAALVQSINKLIKQPVEDSVESLAAYPAFLMAPMYERSKTGDPQVTCLLATALQSHQKTSDSATLEKSMMDAVALPVEQVPTLGLVALLCVADSCAKSDEVMRLTHALETRVQTAANKSNASSVRDANVAADKDDGAVESDALKAAQTALRKAERAALWLVVDCLKRRGEKELSLKFAESVMATEEHVESMSVAQLASRLELIRLKTELGRTDATERELRSIVDALYPPGSIPASNPK